MTNLHGDFIWYELMTTDADAATQFYGAILGWTVAHSEQPKEDYRVFSAGPEQVGGFMTLTPEMTDGGAQPSWAGYISVPDTETAAKAITAAGGQVLMGPNDIPGVGRFAFAADPQGAMFYVMTDTSGIESRAFAKYEPIAGHCAWNELATADQTGAWAFYSALFGWAKDGELDMGPLGTYEFVRTDTVIGAIMPKMPEMPVSAWTFYFRVPDIDVAAAAVCSGGGSVLVEPMEIPGGEFSLNAMDPQGAAFGLVGPRKGA
jgi:uncharacterized protein